MQQLNITIPVDIKGEIGKSSNKVMKYIAQLLIPSRMGSCHLWIDDNWRFKMIMKTLETMGHEKWKLRLNLMKIN